MLLNSLADGTENDPLLTQLLLERGLHRNGVHDGIDSGIAAEGQTLLQGDAQLVERLLQFGVYALLFSFLAIPFYGGVGIIADGLVVDGRQCQVPPCGLLQLLPVAEGLQPERQHPLRLAFLLRNEPDDIFVEADWYDLGFNVGRETELILLLGYATHQFVVVLLFSLLRFPILVVLFHWVFLFEHAKVHKKGENAKFW